MSAAKLVFDFSDDDTDSPQGDFSRDWYAVRNVLVEYLQPDSALMLDDTIGRVSRLYHYRYRAQFVAALSVPVALAEQIPYDHPAHRKLAEFMLAFHDRGAWIAESASEEERQSERRNMWSIFEGELYERDWRTEGEIDKREDCYYPMRYPNFCAFGANVVYPAYRPERFGYFLAKNAFDDVARLEPSLDQDVRDARVLGAAQYIIFQAETILDEVVKFQRRVTEFEAAQPRNCFSKLFRSKRRMERHPERGFEWEEWQAWKEVLRKAAGEETHGDECREVAQRAADLMALQEKLEGNCLAGS